MLSLLFLNDCIRNEPVRAPYTPSGSPAPAAYSKKTLRILQCLGGEWGLERATGGDGRRMDQGVGL